MGNLGVALTSGLTLTSDNGVEQILKIDPLEEGVWLC